MMGSFYACDHNVTGCGCYERDVAYAPAVLCISEYDELAVKRGKLESYWMEHTPQGDSARPYFPPRPMSVRRDPRAIARNQLEGRTRRRAIQRERKKRRA